MGQELTTERPLKQNNPSPFSEPMGFIGRGDHPEPIRNRDPNERLDAEKSQATFVESSVRDRIAFA